MTLSDVTTVITKSCSYLSLALENKIAGQRRKKSTTDLNKLPVLRITQNYQSNFYRILLALIWCCSLHCSVLYKDIHVNPETDLEKNMFAQLFRPLNTFPASSADSGQLYLITIWQVSWSHSELQKKPVPFSYKNEMRIWVWLLLQINFELKFLWFHY